MCVCVSVLAVNYLKLQTSGYLCHWELTATKPLLCSDLPKLPATGQRGRECNGVNSNKANEWQQELSINTTTANDMVQILC